MLGGEEPAALVVNPCWLPLAVPDGFCATTVAQYWVLAVKPVRSTDTLWDVLSMKESV